MARAKKKTRKRQPPPEAPPPPAVASIPAPTGAHRWVARLAVAVAAALAFGRGTLHPLLDGWDDDRFLTDNPLVQTPSVEHFVAIWSGPHFQAYHPLHLLSYWLDVPWAGLDGPAIHVTSLVLWVLALWAVLEAAWALGLGMLGGLAAALLVGLHPAQVEAVTWATGRKDVLALGFSALALLANAKRERPWDRHAWLSLIAYAAACLSKTTALPLPLVMIAADVWLSERRAKAAIVAQLPAALFALSLGAVTVAIWTDAEMLRGQERGLGDRLALVGATLTHHLRVAVWPSDLSPLYPIDRGEGFGALRVMAGPVIAAGAIAWAWTRRRPVVLFVAAAFLALWAPVSNALPLYFQWQDRYLSLPLLPLALGVGFAMDRAALAGPRRWPALATAALAGLLGLRAAQYAEVWSDRLTLFGHAASTQPDSFYAWLQLGHARRDAGQLQGALAAYERAVDAANLAPAHGAMFYVVALIDERDEGLSPSRAEAMAGRFAGALTSADELRGVAGEAGELGYRRAVMMALDYSLRLDPIEDSRLERAASVQLLRGNAWLADYYVSRMRGAPSTPALVHRWQQQHPEEAPREAAE
ncbi:MAG: hypothetical protein VYE22_15910 [Myxococcota bacterium]|nr:hypothetical protein [Myxococcota bacterium]